MLNSKPTQLWGHLPAASQYRQKGKNTQSMICFDKQDMEKVSHSEMLQLFTYLIREQSDFFSMNGSNSTLGVFSLSNLIYQNSGTNY